MPPSPVPEPRSVPPFPPLRVRGGAHRLRRALRRRRRAVAAGLTVVAAAVAASGARGSAASDDAATAAVRGASRVAEDPGPPVRLVSAPVRIADAATVRLLRPGDRVDVIAAPSPMGVGAAAEAAPEARVVAAGVRVESVPGRGLRGPGPDGATDADSAVETADGDAAGGALVVLSVPRATAAELAEAAASSRLVVAVC
ncbi:RcpC/CpaB family pilus assembly protein [Streptomyces sp. NPDC048057]|uniref:RcpC/CpaB family pilus assembly protein n=1 Tax=Streptomyces sp. NPDC048057 TaxID=3155628 RepID=UPI0033FA6668